MNNLFIISNYYAPEIKGGAEVSIKLLAEGMGDQMNVEVFRLGREAKAEIVDGVKVNECFVSNTVRDILNQRETGFWFRLNRVCYKISTYLNGCKYKRKVIAILKNREKGVIHTSCASYFFVQWWWVVAKKMGYKTVHSLRDPMMFDYKLSDNYSWLEKKLNLLHRRYYIKFMAKYVDCVHSPTEYMLSLYARQGFTFKNTVVIPNTLDLEPSLGDYSKKTYDVIYVGNFSKAKGVETLMQIAKKNPRLKVLYVGGGELKAELVAQGQQVMGWMELEQVYQYISQARVLVLPSQWEEAFGRVLVEAVFNGTLPLGSDMGGIPEVLFQDKRYLFEARDQEQLMQGIERILSLTEEDYMQELTTLQDKMQIYRYENHIKQFKTFYNSLLNKDRTL